MKAKITLIEINNATQTIHEGPVVPESEMIFEIEPHEGDGVYLHNPWLIRVAIGLLPSGEGNTELNIDHSLNDLIKEAVDLICSVTGIEVIEDDKENTKKA